MTTPEYPAQDEDNDALTTHPPEEMKYLRILEVPEGRVRYIPEEDSDPRGVVILNYNMFMSVVRELASSQLAPMRAFGQKLELAINHEANAQFAAQLEASKQEGYALGVEDAKAHLKFDGYQAEDDATEAELDADPLNGVYEDPADDMMDPARLEAPKSY